MEDGEQNLENVIACNRRAFQRGQYYRAYHLLAAAIHLAVAEGHADALSQLEGIAREQAAWIREHVSPDARIQHGMKQPDFLHFYDMLAKQIRRDIRVMELRR